MSLVKAVKPTSINLKFILPLAMLYMTIYLCADSVAYKMVKLGFLIDPGPPFIFPLSYVLGAIIAEVYGASISKQIIWTTLLLQLFYALIVKAIIDLPYSLDQSNVAAYHVVFSNILQFVISGMFAVLASSFINIYIAVKSKVLLQGKYFCLRSILATAIGGFVLVFVIVVLVYIPALGFQKGMYMFLCIYALEFLYTLILVLPSWVACGLLKKYERMDVYDYNVCFNPFKF